MDDKSIDLNQPVHDIVTRHPEIMRLMVSLGFKDLENPLMLNTAGRIMTIPKGAKMKNIDLETIKQKIRDLGFTIAESETH